MRDWQSAAPFPLAVSTTERIADSSITISCLPLLATGKRCTAPNSVFLHLKNLLFHLYADGGELLFHGVFPTAIGFRISRTGVGDAADHKPHPFQGFLNTIAGEISDTDDITRFQESDHPAQGPVANVQQRFFFGGFETVGCAVASPGFEGEQRPKVGNKKAPEKKIR